MRCWEKPVVLAIVLSTAQVLISYQLSGFFLSSSHKRLYHVVWLNFSFRVKHGDVLSLVDAPCYCKTLEEGICLIPELFFIIIVFFSSLGSYQTLFIYQLFFQMTEGFVCFYNGYILLLGTWPIMRFQGGRVGEWEDGISQTRYLLVSCLHSWTLVAMNHDTAPQSF